MRTLARPAADIAAACVRLGGVPCTTRELFPDSSPEGIARTLGQFCEERLGSRLVGSEFVEVSAGSVHGLALADGRRVVVKLHRAAVSADYLEAVQHVQAKLAAEGFPCPVPLVGPVPLGQGLATCEALIARGATPNAHDPAVRRLMATELARLIQRLRRFVDLEALRRYPMVPMEGKVWPPPHDARHDFAGTSVGAEWIEALAARAHAVRMGLTGGDWVVGHTDWRVQNMRISRRTLSAMYDWDSLGLEREAVIVGLVARGFSVDWRAPHVHRLPTLDEALGFVRDYDAARAEPFSASEERVARASLVWRMAYSARCEHSDALTDFGRRAPDPALDRGPPVGSARSFLAAHAEALLAVT